MKNHILLMLLFLTGATFQIYAHDARAFRPEATRLSVEHVNNEPIARLHDEQEEAIATLNKTTGAISNIRQSIQPSNFVSTLSNNLDIALDHVQTATLTTALSEAQKNNNYDNFNQTLSAILHKKGKTFDENQFFTILKESEKLNDNNWQSTWNKIKTLTSRGITAITRSTLQPSAEAVKHKSIQLSNPTLGSLFPDTMQTLPKDATPTDVEKFNTLLQSKIPAIRSATFEQIIQIIGRYNYDDPSTLIMIITNLKMELINMPIRFDFMTSTEIVLINDLLKNIGSSLTVNNENYKAVRNIITTFIDNLPLKSSKPITTSAQVIQDNIKKLQLAKKTCEEKIAENSTKESAYNSARTSMEITDEDLKLLFPKEKYYDSNQSKLDALLKVDSEKRVKYFIDNINDFKPHILDSYGISNKSYHNDGKNKELRQKIEILIKYVSARDTLKLNEAKIKPIQDAINALKELLPDDKTSKPEENSGFAAV